MTLFGILWVSLVLGGLFASIWRIWQEPTRRGLWFRLARVPVRKRSGPVCQHRDTLPLAPFWEAGCLPTPERIVRAGPCPRSDQIGCVPEEPGIRSQESGIRSQRNRLTLISDP
jgi:hypothetical protein